LSHLLKSSRIDFCLFTRSACPTSLFSSSCWIYLFSKPMGVPFYFPMFFPSWVFPTKGYQWLLGVQPMPSMAQNRPANHHEWIVLLNECKCHPSFWQSIRRVGQKNPGSVNKARLCTDKIILNFLLENILRAVLLCFWRGPHPTVDTQCALAAPFPRKPEFIMSWLSPWQRHTDTSTYNAVFPSSLFI
jgi:hypothetical protein